MVVTKMQSESALSAIPPDVPEISREELRSRLKTPSLSIVDVLPSESYAAEHILGAISLPFDSIARRASELLPDRNAEIVVYCAKFT
jgi:rhodanese-related sulfurtransferase